MTAPAQYRPLTEHSADEKAQLTHAITQVLEFFGKHPTDTDIAIWLRALRKYPYATLREALIEATGRLRFAPRPANVIEIIEELRGEKVANTRGLPAPTPQSQSAPPNVARAYTWLARQWAGTGESLFADPKLTEDEVEDALEIVNRHAAKTGNAQAIPEHCYLPSHWGGLTYDQAIADQHTRGGTR